MKTLKQLAFTAAALLAVTGCKTKTETRTVEVQVTAPSVAVAGAEFLVLTGTTAQLSATTADGTDAGYTWASSDTAVATVDGTGLVTGLTPGSTIISATGQTTGAVGRFNMVVANDIAQVAQWQGSAHAAYATEPFRHWDGDGAIPTSCARCHSQYGFRDYLGDDGSAAFVVDAAAPLGSVVDCMTCHNAAASTLSQVTFPSGVTLTGLGPEAKCMTCHQGREAKDTVDARIATARTNYETANGAGSFTDDVKAAGLGFVNIHYFAAGATLNAGRVRGGYQYDLAPDGLTAKVYDYRFRHVPGLDTCVGCHDQHTLQLKVDACATCHTQVAGATYAEKVASLRAIRMASSKAIDYDGDGILAEGISAEIDTLRDALGAAMRAYTADQGLAQICYSGTAYPYFFEDTDGSGLTCDAGETTSFKDWTARLERAAYNYQVSLKDPGAFAHNAKYLIELLFDSIENVNAGIAVAANRVDMTGMVRGDFGHFNGAGEPARHWDGDEAVSASCSKCHGGSEGFKFFLTYGVGQSNLEQDNGLDCVTCHKSFSPFPTAAAPNLEQPAGVLFPGATSAVTGASVGLSPTSMLCATCHSGRESMATLEAAIASGRLGFRNVHYLPAGATVVGAASGVGVTYPGKTYATQATHNGSAGSADCTFCHSAEKSQHTFLPEAVFADATTTCKTCHAAAATVADIRNVFSVIPDLDGDGDANEPLAGEVAGLEAALLAQIQATASAGGSPICYDGARYPYWFQDQGGTCSTTSYSAFTAPLLRAAFNYQYSHKEPGAWAHNWRYVSQLLMDSTEDLGGPANPNRP